MRGPEHRFYRDSEHGLVAGVASGLAEWLDCPRWLIRAAFIIITWEFTLPAVIAYAITALVTPVRPLRYHGDGEESQFWRSRGGHDHV